MLGLRLGDMPSGYTKPDGSKVPSGWDVYAAELGEALRSALVGSPALGVTARDRVWPKVCPSSCCTVTAMQRGFHPAPPP